MESVSDKGGEGIKAATFIVMMVVIVLGWRCGVCVGSAGEGSGVDRTKEKRCRDGLVNHLYTSN